MTDLSDDELLERYAATGEDSLFENLVQRHVDWVYSAASRILSDRGLAEEATQNVFIVLAKKAPTLAKQRNLSGRLRGWLHRAAVLEAKKRIRTEARRRHREEKAGASLPQASGHHGDLKDLGPLLDDGLAKLPARQKEALILRFFQEKSLREVGNALGIGEDAAQKRVAKSLQSLASFFRGQGYTVSAGALTLSFFQETSKAAAPGLTKTIGQQAVLGSPSTLARVAPGFSTTLLSNKLAALSGFLILLLAFLSQYQALSTIEAARQDRVLEIADYTRRYQEHLAQSPIALAETDANLEPPPLTTTAETFHWDDHPELVRVRREALDQIDILVFTPELTLTDELCALLSIGEETKTQLQQVVADTVADLQALERQHVVVDDVAPKGFSASGAKRTWRVPAFAEEGAPLKAHLLTTFEEVLGTTRSNHLFEMGERVFLERLADFGALERTVSMVVPEDEQSDQRTIYFEYRRPTGPGSHVQSAVAGTYHVGAVPPELRDLITNFDPLALPPANPAP